MAEYDGTIQLGVKLKPADVKESARQLGNEISNIFKQTAGKDVSAQFKSLETQMSKSVSKAQELTAKLVDLENTKVPTEQYAKLQAELDKIDKSLEKLGNESVKLQKSGDQSPKVVQRLKEIEEEADKLQTKYANIEDRMYDMEQAETAFTSGSTTQKYQDLTNKLADVNNQQRVYLTKAQQLTEKENAQKEASEKLAKAKEKLATATKKVKNASKEAAKAQKSFGTNIDVSQIKVKKLLGLIVKWGFGIRSVFIAYRKLRAAISEAWKNMAQINDGNNAVNKSLSEVTSSLTYLKNSFGAAFAPILTVVAPIISKFVDMMADAANAVGMLIARLSGQKTFLKAIKVYKDYAKSIKDSNKEQKQQLANYDKLNNVSSKDKDDENKPDEMFKEVPVDSAVPKWLQDLQNMLKPLIDRVKELKDLFMNGFKDAWDFLNIDEQVQDVLDSLNKIWQHLKDIFGDPEVVEAFNNMLDKWAYAAGQIVASIASIILTILQNILGGIEKYLDQNKERIQQYLISMFDIWGVIGEQLGNFFVAFANIFQAFASDEGKQLTANFIGIFADAFMGVTELISKFIRDLFILLTQPIIDNANQIREVLTEWLGFLAEVTGTIKDFIDTTMDHLNEMYDAHIKPLFESLTRGVSEIVRLLLEFWQQKVQPLLDDFAKKFDELFKAHIQPLMDEIIKLIGKIADTLKLLWENVVMPFIQWFIANVLPTILPVIQTIYTTIVNVFGDFADIIKSAIKIIEGIIDFLTGVFTGDWDKAWQGILQILDGILGVAKGWWEALFDFFAGIVSGAIEGLKGDFEIAQRSFEAVGEFINGIFENIKLTISDAMDYIAEEGIREPINMIIEFFEGLANSVVDAVNTIIDAINTLSFDVPDWVPEIGGETFGFNLSHISPVTLPRLAQGAVIPPNAPFVAMLGDQHSGTNVEAPLETIQQALYGALVQAGLTGGGSNEDIVIQIDGREIARAVRKEDNIFRKSTGTSMFAY